MSKAPDMAVTIAGIRMKNPVLLASGTCGYGPEYADLIDLNALGGITVKGILAVPWEGNTPIRLTETPAGLLNAIGLQNPGMEKFISEYMPFLRRHQTAVIVNIWGRTMEEYGEVAARFDDVEGVHALELNISCPNLKAGGMEFGTDPKTAAQVISLVRKRTRLPLIPKLSPTVHAIAQFARVAEESGADAISLINSVPAMVIDVERRRPVLSNGVGGLTGAAIRPIAVRLVWQAARAVKIPIIGMGGISCGRDALEFLIAGASAVAVGTATFLDPGTALRVVSEIETYLQKHNLASVRDVIGTLEVS
ncbi:MAG: dihydroorotate dehydrogenase [Verrucomicrobia bacterium]|nr:dihydroorotate dehydrogenase [Verrucomicrobiota bacterium]